VADTYTVTEAAKVLRVSPRRVRQYVAEGRLEVIESGPTRLDVAAVLALREARGERAAQATAKTAGHDPALDLLREFADRLEAQYSARLAITERAEADLREALHTERAAREAAEREATDLRERLATAQAPEPARKRWFRRD
jgi:excisionase family DNA binding protein